MTKHLRTLFVLLCCNIVAATTLAQQPAEFRYKGQSLADGATVTITTAVTDPFTGSTKFETNAGPGDQGLILQNLTAADISSAQATLTITKKTIAPSLVQWCMGSDCVPLTSDSYQKQFAIARDGYVRVEFDALATQYGELEATLACMVNLRVVSVKIRFVHADPAASSKVWWGYAHLDPNELSMIGIGQAETYSCAALYSASTPMLKGGTVSGVRFYLSDKTNISGVSVWLSKSLPATADKADIMKVDVPDAQLADIVHDGSMVEVALPTPYVMGSTDVYVGYTFTVKALSSDADYYPVAFGPKPASGVKAFYMRTSKTLPVWSDYSASYGALGLQLLVSNASMPQYDAAVAAVKPRTVAVSGQAATLDAVVTDLGLAPVYNVDYVVTVGGQPQAERHYELPQPVASYGTAFLLPAQLAVPAAAGISDASVSITRVNGVAVASQQAAAGRLVSASQLGHRRSVVEEYTGTWCVNCPRGHVGLQALADKFGDDCIAIAAHNNDPMAIAAYQDKAINPGSFPHCVMDRTIDCDPYVGYGNKGRHFAADEPFAEMLAQPAEADVALTAYWSGDNTIGYDVQTTFHTNAATAPYALALVVTADGLTGTTKDWAQVNGDSGSSAFPDADMDWWRQQPNPATAVSYNHVAIWADGLVGGISGSVEAPVADGQTQHYSGTVDMAGNSLVQDKSRLCLVAMLLDTQSGQVVNAAKASVSVAGAVTAVGGDDRRPAFYDLQGRRVDRPSRGLYISGGRKVMVK